MATIDDQVQDEQADDQISAAVRAIMVSRPTFKVGDRVRVTGGVAECRAVPTRNARAIKLGQHRGHFDWELGMLGTVGPQFVEPERRAQGHTVFVVMDAVPAAVRPCIGASYAPTELELIS